VSSLEIAFADGQLAALHKLGWAAPSDPTVAGSAVLRAKSSPTEIPQTAQANLAPPTTPQSLSQIFDAHQQGSTRTEPKRKLSAELCTTCRRAKHYGSCDAPKRIPEKAADFNAGLLGSDPSQGDNPSTSPHYHAATTADSSLARARDGRPADEQAASLFADLFRHEGIRNSADEPGQMTGGLNKVAEILNIAKLRARRAALLEKMFAISKLGDWQMWGTDGHSSWEQRGPGGTPNPYEERLTVKSPPVGFGDEGPQRIRRAFDQIDGAVDSTNIEDASKGQPSGGPPALG
jgi:hypothetical protein